jgi:glycosyltransferase involved in cell wall biosynthesis
MNIINVHPGILPIPPKNWGAIEKCIWNYHTNFQKLGFSSKIKYLNDIQNDGHSIIHSHVTNLANEAHNRGLEYFFSMHDHHVLFDYPNTDYVNETRKAVKNSVKTFVHTEEFFTHPHFKDLSDKFIYLRHGVDVNTYVNTNSDRNGLLCVASNGFIGFKYFDRKGFLLARQVAEHLNMPLTICCPSNTKEFLEYYGFTNDSNVTIFFDLDETQLIEKYNTHKIFLHPSILEAGHPNLTLVEALACGLPVVGTYKGGLYLNGMCVVNDLTPISYVNAVRHVLSNYDEYTRKTTQNELFTWESVSKSLIGWYKKYGHTKKKFLDTLMFSYNDRNNISHKTDSSPKLSISFDTVPKVELKTIENKSHTVKFITLDNSGNETNVYQTQFSNGMWACPNNMYAKNWKVYLDDQLKYETNIDIEKDVCAIISTHPNSDGIIEKTRKTILNIKENIGLTTICAAHTYPIRNRVEFINNVPDYYVMNPVNTLTQHNYYRYYFGVHGEYTVNLDLWNSGNGMYHGPAVHQNYYNGVKRAKELGYKYALLTNFDMLFSDEDITKIKCILNTVIVNNSNGFFFFTQEPEGPTYKTVFCVVNIDMFLKTFPEILNESDYNKFVSDVGSESNSLENVYYHALKNINGLVVKEMAEWQFFNSKECFTNSQANYFAVLPLENDPQYNTAVFIKRVDNDSTGVSGFVRIDSSDYVEWEHGDIKTEYHNFITTSDFVNIIPFKFERGRKYEIEFQMNIPENVVCKNIVIDDLEKIKLNGSITK